MKQLAYLLTGFLMSPFGASAMKKKVSQSPNDIRRDLKNAKRLRAEKGLKRALENQKEVEELASIGANADEVATFLAEIPRRYKNEIELFQENGGARIFFSQAHFKGWPAWDEVADHPITFTRSLLLYVPQQGPISLRSQRPQSRGREGYGYGDFGRGTIEREVKEPAKVIRDGKFGRPTKAQIERAIDKEVAKLRRKVNKLLAELEQN